MTPYAAGQARLAELEGRGHMLLEQLQRRIKEAARSAHESRTCKAMSATVTHTIMCLDGSPPFQE